MSDQSKEAPSTPSAPTPRDWEHTPDYRELYANNVRFENSAWDLKLMFGLLDQSEGGIKIRQHTAMHIPWAQAKLVAYFLHINIAFQEQFHGPVHVPLDAAPPDLRTMFPRLEDEPDGRELLKRVDAVRAHLFGS